MLRLRSCDAVPPRARPGTGVLATTSVLAPVGLVILLAGLVPAPLAAHGEDPRFHPELPFASGQIVRALGLGRSLGLRARPSASLRRVGARECVEAGLVGFDVADEFGFDIDRGVELEVLVDASASPASLLVAHDRNGSADSRQEVTLPTDASGLVWVKATLERARFAGRGSFGTDLAIGVPTFAGTLTICDLRLSFGGQGEPVSPPGRLSLRLMEDVSGEPTAARVGLYDASGRAPLPSEAALPVDQFYEERRMVAVRRGSPWPVANRWVFYVDGTYAASLPAGTYDLLVAKGLEHRIARRRVVIEPGEETVLSVPVERWDDMASRGWYGGDVHVHLPRTIADNPRVLAQMAAEDLDVTHLLEIGNIHRTWFEQPAWGAAGRYAAAGRHLASGQENPTTGHRGHVLALGLEQPVRDLDHYFLYERTFEQVARQGGLVGYAHLSPGWFHVERGLALDVPHELVDFVEVLQIGLCDVELWYPFLDLGFALVPVAGSDYPYVDLPGTVRNYVEVEGELSVDRWLAGLEAGRTFVTNGPLLELDIAGHGMGEHFAAARGQRLRIEASARINPDLDRLVELQLVAHGEVIASVRSEAGEEQLRLSHEVVVEDGMWLALRARGAFEERWNTIVAHSAPVYVTVDGGLWWKRERVAEIVAAQLAHLDALAAAPIDPTEDLMFWDTEAATRARWQAQRDLLIERIERTRAIYEALRAAAAEG